MTTRVQITPEWKTAAITLLILACTVTLAGCSAGSSKAARGSSTTTAAQPATSDTPTTAAIATTTTSTSAVTTSSSTNAASASGATTSVADGTYRLSADPACGEFVMDGASLRVQGSTANITQGNIDGTSSNRDSSPPATGSIAGNRKSFQIHVANGRAAVIDLTGTVNAAGTLTGDGQSGGVHINVETGWSCRFTFTGTPGTATSSTGQTLNVDTFYSPSRNISCQILSDSTICQTNAPPQFVTMSTSGAFTTCTGPTCVGNVGENTPILAYGDTTDVGPFQCVSATSGVTCTAAGKGFRISSSGVTKVP